MGLKMDFELARENMIEQQIRTWDVLDLDVLDLLKKIPRELFFSDEYKSLALADTEIPIGHDQTSLSPKIEARILQALQIRPDDEILEIGTGCGYLTALLAKTGKHVTSIEIFSDLSESAQTHFKQSGLENIEAVCADALTMLPVENSYDVVVIGASMPLMIEAYPMALKSGGRLFAVAGKSPIMDAQLITCSPEGLLHNESLFETEIPPLIGFQEKPEFKL